MAPDSQPNDAADHPRPSDSVEGLPVADSQPGDASGDVPVRDSQPRDASGDVRVNEPEHGDATGDVRVDDRRPNDAADDVRRDDPLPNDAAGGVRLDNPDLMVAMRGVSRRFEDRVVLRDVNLAVPRGTILGIIGPSGAGKTTTIRMLTGAIAPTSGNVAVMGRDPRRFHRSDRERIGYMPQSFTLYTDLTAGENIDFVASLFGMLWRRRRRRVREVLNIVDLWDARGRQAGRLSGGMQRRLELACALVHEPELIILDEPTAGIDPLLRGSIWEELHRLRDAGRTLLVTTQHVSEAEECDAVAMIVDGQFVALAPPDDLRRLATNGYLLD
ncbi:MAG: type transport system ATP-binding protein, partial [Chloroflexota bacterium]|nr:type transport system ATP-binding protein [Chloroflexota bacterium]